MTEELKAEQKVIYPRDTSLDPQLVWKGKDEQDSQDLEVPSVPIYIQEKIHPQAIIDDFKRSAEKDQPEPELNFFNDFNGIQFEDMIEFYQHEQNWSNRMILGDSLHVMTSLAEREGLKGKVQMIYIDPPYGIKFGSNWQVSTRKLDVNDGKASDVTRQPEQIKAFRDTWELGIHSYLSYLRDRLVVARELLTESGSVFVQIGDENVHLVRCLMDEVFGSENFISLITTKKSGGMGQKFIDNVGDFIILYGKNIDVTKYRQLFTEKRLSDGPGFRYSQVESEDGSVRPISFDERLYPKSLPSNCKVYLGGPLTSETASNSTIFDFHLQNHLIKIRKGGWKTNISGMKKLIKANRLIKTKEFANYKMYFDDFPVVALSNLWEDTMGTAEQDKIYVVQTTKKVIQRCILMTTDPGDLVLDPTCGSGATAYVAEQWGRRWITIDTSRVALALARTRLMSAKYPYYLLADSRDGVRKEAEISGRIPPEYNTDNDIKKGFVYKSVPHVTLKSIANNAEIDAIYSEWQEELEPIREKLNKQTGKQWEEWEIPRDPDKGWSKDVCKLHLKWWEFRIKRQEEIDASIARNADTETLYDQPYEDKKKIRVTGPFTIESLSPHRRLSVEEKIKRVKEGFVIESMPDVVLKTQEIGPGDFGRMILDNLKKAGVQNTFKNERLKFDYLDIFPGEWLHGSGEYTETDGAVKSVAVCIGPEHGTVGPELVKEAAKEAVKGTGFDTLIVCGFAFDPMVTEETKHYGKLTILPAKMNPDLAMGDELLKKTGAGNLFMIFGEPDVEIKHLKDDQIQVEIHGLDVYDPTTGQVRSSSTDDIACWFIDTDYNQESFFVRHAYFTGADRPYEKLKKALKAEIDESAWSTLYSTKSRSFPKPDSGKIAIKVINHYGDEVLKVYEV